MTWKYSHATLGNLKRGVVCAETQLAAACDAAAGQTPDISEPRTSTSRMQHYLWPERIYEGPVKGCLWLCWRRKGSKRVDLGGAPQNSNLPWQLTQTRPRPLQSMLKMPIGCM